MNWFNFKMTIRHNIHSFRMWLAFKIADESELMNWVMQNGPAQINQNVPIMIIYRK